MKKQQTKKLVLSKIKIASLSNHQQSQLNGGGIESVLACPFTQQPHCYSDFRPCSISICVISCRVC
jgi:hypothetical protein